MSKSAKQCEAEIETLKQRIIKLEVDLRRTRLLIKYLYTSTGVDYDLVYKQYLEQVNNEPEEPTSASSKNRHR